jgi:hypothetical protein
MVFRPYHSLHLCLRHVQVAVSLSRDIHRQLTDITECNERSDGHEAMNKGEKERKSVEHSSSRIHSGSDVVDPLRSERGSESN